MINKRKEAVSNYGLKGNCAQAILLAFKDELNLDEEILKSIGKGFGGGTGGSLKGVCGALNGAILVFSILNKDMSKLELNKHIQNMINKFESQNSTIFCGDLKGIKTRIPLRNCHDCIDDATKFLIEELDN